MSQAHSISISGPQSTGVDGVVCHSIRGSAFSWSHVGWSEQLISVGGQLFLAGTIVDRLIHGLGVRSLPYSFKGCVKFGPGGRRLYVPVTEALIDEIISDVASDFWRENEREAARRDEIASFCEALIEAL